MMNGLRFKCSLLTHWSRFFGKNTVSNAKATELCNSEVQRKTHLELTANHKREDVTSLATVVGIKEISKTVRQIRLKVHHPYFTFKAGQWVDFFIPTVDIAGGYSICSSPLEFDTDGHIDLAVKKGLHPPTLWLHEQCHVGSVVNIRVGGDFYIDPCLEECNTDILLIAGGVGINPIVSILRHVSEQYEPISSNNNLSAGFVILLYSASTADELLFVDVFQHVKAKMRNFRCKYFITKEGTTCIPGAVSRRIQEQDIIDTLESLNRNRVVSYICGPPPMIAEMERYILNHSVPQERIKFEKWW